MITPAALSFAAMPLSLGTLAPSKAYEPAVLFIWSMVAMLFLIRIGMPCRALRIVPFFRSASSVAAMLSASGFNSVTGRSIGLTSSMRKVYARTRSTDEKRPASKPITRSSAVASSRSGYAGIEAMLQSTWATTNRYSLTASRQCNSKGYIKE